jgi:hypothetical protein
VQNAVRGSGCDQAGRYASEVLDDEMMRMIRKRGEVLAEVSRGASIDRSERLEEVTASISGLRMHAAFAESVKAWTAPFGLLGTHDWRLPMDALAGLKMLETSALGTFQTSAFASLDVASRFEELMPPHVGAELMRQIKALDVSSLINDHVKSIAASVAFDASSHIARLQDQLAEPLRELAELFDGYEEDERLVLERLVPRGWLISPSMAIRTIRLLAREIEDGTGRGNRRRARRLLRRQPVRADHLRALRRSDVRADAAAA